MENRSRQRSEILSSVGFFHFRSACFHDYSAETRRSLSDSSLPTTLVDATAREFFATFPSPTSIILPLTFQFQITSPIKIWRYAVASSTSIIQRLRQNAVNLMIKDQDVKQLADIVAELCLVCEDQQKRIGELTEELDKLRSSAV